MSSPQPPVSIRIRITICELRINVPVSTVDRPVTQTADVA